MSSAASLALLKAGKKKDLATELDAGKGTAEVEAPVEEEEEAGEATEAVDGEATEEVKVDVDVNKLSAKELDELVAEHSIEVPETWKKMTVAQKRVWLTSQFGDEETQAEAETTKAPEPSKAVATTTAKAPAKGKASKGEVLPKDELSDIIHEIENLKEKDADKLVDTLAEQGEVTAFKLGGVLSRVQQEGWFKPYATFREYIELGKGIHYRRAMYYVAIYNALAESGVPYAKVKHIGWTKLKEIAAILTQENVDEWVKIAEGQTVLQLIETVKNHNAKKAQKLIGEGGEPEQAKTIVTKTFKMHTDQKETIEAAIEKAKEKSNTTIDTVALEYICLEYVSGKQLTLDQMLNKLDEAGLVGVMSKLHAKLGLEKSANAISTDFPNVNFSLEVPEAQTEA